METYMGKSVFGGVAIGKISVNKKTEQQIKRVKIADVEVKLARFEAARKKAIEQLKRLYEKALKEGANPTRRFSRLTR